MIVATLSLDRTLLEISFEKNWVDLPSMQKEGICSDASGKFLDLSVQPNNRAEVRAGDRFYEGEIIHLRDSLLDLYLDNGNRITLRNWDSIEYSTGNRLTLLSPSGKTPYVYRGVSLALRWQPVYYHFIRSVSESLEEGSFSTLLSANIESDLDVAVSRVTLLSVLKSYSQLEGDPNEIALGEVKSIKVPFGLEPHSRISFNYDEVKNSIEVDSYIIELEEGTNLATLKVKIKVGADMPRGEHVFTLNSGSIFRANKGDLLDTDVFYQSLGSVKFNSAFVAVQNDFKSKKFDIQLFVNAAGYIKFRYYTGNINYSKINTSLRKEQIGAYLYFSNFFDIGSYDIKILLNK